MDEDDVSWWPASGPPYELVSALRRAVPPGFTLQPVEGGVVLERTAFPFQAVRATVTEVDGAPVVRVEQVERAARVRDAIAFGALPCVVFAVLQCSAERSHALAGWVVLLAYKAFVADLRRPFDAAVGWVRDQVSASTVAGETYRTASSGTPPATPARVSVVWPLVAFAATVAAIGWAPFAVRLPLAWVLEAAQCAWLARFVQRRG